VLLTFLIPVLLLVFFSLVDVLPTGQDDPVTFLFPGVLALAVMSTSMVAVAIATGFERQLGVLKRLGATPLTRGQLLGAKTAAMAVIEAAQVVVLTLVALALGFRFTGAQVLPAVAGAALASVAFAGIGLLLAGTLRALTTLAAANGLYLVLLLLSGMVIPLDELPDPVATVAPLLPSSAWPGDPRGPGGRGRARSGVAGAGGLGRGHPVVAARLFRWGDRHLDRRRRRDQSAGLTVSGQDAASAGEELEGGEYGHVHRHGQSQAGVEDPGEDLAVELQVHEHRGHHEELEPHHGQEATDLQEVEGLAVAPVAPRQVGPGHLDRGDRRQDDGDLHEQLVGWVGVTVGVVRGVRQGRVGVCAHADPVLT
jgi:ABC-2 type transport system permease protein